MMVQNNKESDTDSYVEYDGKQYRDINELKNTIDFSISKLKDQYDFTNC